MEMSFLPNEIYLKIFSFLEKKDIKAIRRVSLLFNDLGSIILFSFPIMKKKLRLNISQCTHLPFLYIDNRYLKRFLDVTEFPATVRTVVLSQRKPTVSPEIISQNQHIQFFISFGYFYPVDSSHHQSNYALLKNVKLYSSTSSSMRYQVLQKYTNFIFQYINTAHIESFATEIFSSETGLHILSQLKVNRLVLMKSNYFRITAKQLFQFDNIVCISSAVLLEKESFPFKLIQQIQTLEVIFIWPGTLFYETDLLELKRVTPHSSYHYRTVPCSTLARFTEHCFICLKRPKNIFGKTFIPMGSPSTWFQQIFRLYTSADLLASGNLH